MRNDSVLPDPVPVATTTLRPSRTFLMAASWCRYRGLSSGSAGLAKPVKAAQSTPVSTSSRMLHPVA